MRSLEREFGKVRSTFVKGAIRLSKKHGRHTSSFLLLFLNGQAAYGAALLQKMQTELPYCFSDSAIVYRSLQDLEKNGLVETRWEIPDTGAPRKWYSITPTGRAALVEHAEDIRQRSENFGFFLHYYEKTTCRESS